MNHRALPALQVDTPPTTTVAAIAAAGSVALPATVDGAKYQLALIQCQCDTLGEAIWIDVNEAAGNGAAATGMPIVSGSNGLIVDVSGGAYIGYDIDTVRAPANLSLFITPLLNDSIPAPVVAFESGQSKRVAPTSAGSSTTIPNLANGDPPAYLLLQSVLNSGSAIGKFVVVSPEYGAVAADVLTGLPIVMGNDPFVLNVKGFSHIGYELFDTGTAFLSMTPLASQ